MTLNQLIKEDFLEVPIKRLPLHGNRLHAQQHIQQD